MKQNKYRVIYNGKHIGYQNGMNAESVWADVCRANPDHDRTKFEIILVKAE